MKSRLLPSALLVAAFGCCALAACQKNTDGDPVDYGPAVGVKDVTGAVANMVHDSDPTQTKVGAYARFLTTADIGGGAVWLPISNTTQEVTSRSVDGGILTLNIYETNTDYRNGAPVKEKITRNFSLNFRVTPSPTPAPLAEPPLASEDFEQAIAAYLAQNEVGRPRELMADPAVTPTPTPTATPRPPSYHRLRAWEDTAPPPARVQAQPNCLGIPNCRIRLRHVIFNIVIWDEPQGNLIRVELVSSPDVPQTLGFNMNPIWRYIPGLMQSCIARLMYLGNDTRNRTLVNECKTVVNFAYDSATP